MASPEINEKNILAIKKHSEDSRNLVRGAESEVNHLKKVVESQASDIVELKKAIDFIRVKLFTGGATGP